MAAGCRTVLIGRLLVNKPGVPDKRNVGLRVTVKQPRLGLSAALWCWPVRSRPPDGGSCAAHVVQRRSPDPSGCPCHCTSQHSPQEGCNRHPSNTFLTRTQGENPIKIQTFPLKGFLFLFRFWEVSAFVGAFLVYKNIVRDKRTLA